MFCINKAELNLMNEMRVLWEQHTVWTRMAIMSIVYELPNEEQVIARLLRNPVDFGNTFSRYYGTFIGNKLRDLLTEHLVLAADLVKAVIAGDNQMAMELERRWYENANEIAILLGAINPFWSVREWREMLFEHLRLVKLEATTTINGEHQENVDVYDELEAQALEMADTMSKGIIMQFPERFCN